MTFGFGVQGKAEGNQALEVAGTFSLEKLRKEVDDGGRWCGVVGKRPWRTDMKQ